MEDIAAAFDTLTAQIQTFLKEFQEGPSLQDQVLAFVHAVDWTEPWIIGLLASHVLLLLAVLALRKYETFQFFVFTASVLAVWCAEHLNAFAAVHWKSFSRQDYFDKFGLFTTIMFSGPLMIICIIILIQLMYAVIQNMVKWKRAELKHRARAAAQAQKEGGQRPEKRGAKEE